MTMTGRHNPTDRAEIERDPITCAVNDCPDPARVATPEGPMCHLHADELAEGLR